MTDDPRLIVVQEWLTQPDGRHLETARVFLAELDAVDPLRHPVSQDRVEAAMCVLYGENWRDCAIDDTAHWYQTTTAALAAADRVQAPAEKPDFPPWSREMAALVRETAEWTVANASQKIVENALTPYIAAAFPETKDAS